MRVLLFLLLSTALASAEPKLLPIDEATKDSGFANFKKDLAVAVEGRDAKFIESVLASDALASFGGDRGVAGFRSAYGFVDPGAPFWRELAKVLSLGGTFNRTRKEFSAPYVHSRWPDDFDAMDYVVLIQKDVVVRSAASSESKEIVRLSYSILKLDSGSESTAAQEWIAVQLPAGGTGFVPAAVVRSPLDYRAQFRREGRQWKIASFLAGD